MRKPPLKAPQLTSYSRTGKGAAPIRNMLRFFNVPRDGVLFVHSAFKGFSHDGYQAESVLEALIDYMQPGTLLLPTMSWRYVKPASPFFDELETPSNTGILTELFRQQYATQRSLHPTHSVAGYGKNIDALLGSHHRCTTPCGKESPFAKLVAVDAIIIMLGVGMDCCTLVHHGEEMCAPDYYVHPKTAQENYTCKDRNGHEKTVQLRRHLFLPRNYWQFQDRLAEQGALRVYRCDNSICLGFSARDLNTQVTRVLQQQADAIIAKPGQRFRMM